VITALFNARLDMGFSIYIRYTFDFITFFIYIVYSRGNVKILSDKILSELFGWIESFKFIDVVR